MNKDDTTNTNKIHSNTWLIWTLILLLLLGLAAIFAAKENLVRFLNVDVNKDKTVVIGQRGADGKAGLNGLDGNSGSSGQNGSSGSSGAAGANGAQGVPGSNDCISGICVSRQASTPGTQEAGNINIDGALIAAQAGIGTNTPSNTLSVAGTANFGGHTATGAGATVNGITSGSDAISGISYHNTVGAVYETLTTLDSASTMYEALGGVLKLDPSSAPSFSQIAGNNGGVEIAAGNAENFTGNITGMNGSIIHSGTGTATTGVGLQGVLLNLSTGTISSGYGLRSIGINLNPGGSSGTITNYVGIESSFAANAGTITNQKGIQIQTPNNFGTITNNYGLYIQDQSTVGSNLSYNFYSAGSSSKNRLDGEIQSRRGQTGVRGVSFYDDNFAIGMSGTDLALTTVSGSSNGISFTNNGVGGTTLMRIRGDGRVGIGTSSPGGPLHIYSTNQSGDGDLIIENVGTPGVNNGAHLTFRKASDGPGSVCCSGILASQSFQAYDGASYLNAANITVYDGPGASGQGEIAFSTSPDGSNSPVERMRIDYQGNVGIGDTAPATRLEIRGTGAITTLQEWQNSVGTTLGQFSVGNDASPYGNLSLYTSNGDYGPRIRLNSSGNGGSSWIMTSAGPGDYTGTGSLEFILGSDPHVSFKKNGLNQFRAITGQTANIMEWQNSTGTPLGSVSATGTIAQSGATNCAVSANASGELICTSDERLKDVSGEYKGGLDELAAINTIRFNYKGEDYSHVGFSAQNVGAVLPEGAPMQSNGYLGLDSNAILALSVNSIKELDTTVGDLQGTFATALEKTNGDLAATNEILASLGLRVDDLSEKLNELADRLSEHDDRLSTQDDKIRLLETEIQNLKQQLLETNTDTPVQK